MSSFTGTIEGNLTKDPELRFTPSGAAVCNFTVAHTPRKPVKDQPGQWEDAGETVFVRVTAWRAQAENVAATLVKGCNAVVTGDISQSSYINKENVNVTSIEITAKIVSVPLTRQTAAIEKSTANNSGGGNSGGNANRNQPQQQQQTQNDPWAGGDNASGGGFSDEPPF